MRPPSLPKAHLISVEDLKPRDRNPRTHSRRQISKIARSIEEFGFLNPVLVDQHNRIVAGHGRVLAAQKLGLSEVPVLRVEHLCEQQLRAYVIADNELAAQAGWDRELLAIELGALVELNFDVELTGFDMGAVDLVIGQHEAEKRSQREDDLDGLTASSSAVSNFGDIWILGHHRIICGNALDAATYSLLLEDEKVRLTLTDPPYNVQIQGHVTSRKTQGEFAMASGEMSREQFTKFLQDAFARVRTVSAEGALAQVFMDWRHLREILEAGDAEFAELLNLVVWAKNAGGMGSLYRSRHELVFVFKVDDRPHTNNVMLGTHGRDRTNVWEYAGYSAIAAKDPLASEHPTPKPVRLLADAILDVTDRNEVVLDPFAGSGSLLLAAERTGRRARAIELEPRFVDLAVRRWQRQTGKKATHAVSGRRFDEIAAEQ
ncbi:MAG: DNA methyltransferase [Hyphomicrobiales bacterium]